MERGRGGVRCAGRMGGLLEALFLMGCGSVMVNGERRE